MHRHMHAHTALDVERGLLCLATTASKIGRTQMLHRLLARAPLSGQRPFQKRGGNNCCCSISITAVRTRPAATTTCPASLNCSLYTMSQGLAKQHHIASKESTCSFLQTLMTLILQNQQKLLQKKNAPLLSFIQIKSLLDCGLHNYFRIKKVLCINYGIRRHFQKGNKYLFTSAGIP